ncbi:MAG: PAS domain-containing protein, partial [Syntrophobacteraceae bacterium]
GFSSLIHPEDLSVIQERLEGILRGERRVGYEARILTRSGEYRILELKTVPLVRKGGVVGALGTARDVTARRLAENETNKQKEFLGNVLESLSYPFYVFDANDYTIQMANSAAAPFGLHPNITCHTLPHGEFGSCTRAEHICSLEKIKQTGQPLITEHLHYDREGKPKYLEVHGYPIVDSNGKVAQIIEYSLDVSERRKVEEELRRTRDDLAREKSLLDAVLNQMPSGIIVAEPGGGIILSNQQASEILEHPRKHLSHRDEYSEYRALHPDGRPYEPGEYLLTRALHRGEIIIDEEVQIVLPSSGTKTVLASASPVKDIDGKVVAAVVTFQDISDRKRAEAELHRREQEYRALVENSPDVVMRVDRNLRRIFANRALETVTGYPVSHFVGSSIYEPEREDRKEYIALMERACRRVLSTGEEEAFEFPYPTTKGTRYFYMRIVPEYSKNNQIESLLTISRDVTDLRQVQEELRRARDELELRVRERTSELGEANKALKLDEARLEALWKLSQMDEVSNRDVADFTLKQQIRLTRSKNGAIGFMNDEGSVFTLYSCTAGFLDSGMVGEKPVSFPIESVPLLAEVVRNQQPIVAGNLDVSSLGAICPRISDGFHRFMCVPAMEGDRVLAVAIVANKDEEYDSSDIRQVTLLLDGMGKLVRRREAVKALRQAETLAAMGRALSAVAHDVKTPLVAIGGFTRIVHGHLDQSSADRAKLDIVINEVRRLEGLLENILDFSRPLKLDKSLQDVSSIILESLTVMEDLAQQRDLKIETGLADLPRVYIDPMRMKQVIINLVMNALQASPPGNTVTVTTQLRGKRLLIDVKDQGNGVPSNKREEIFAPFFSTKKEGTGLGLPISKKIIEAHNGSIHVLDNAGKGATFRLMFPALTGNHDAQKGEAP